MDSAVPQIVTGKEDTMQRGAQPLRHEAARCGAISNTLPFLGYCTCKNGVGTDLGEPRDLDKSFDFLQALEYVSHMKSSLHPPSCGNGASANKHKYRKRSSLLTVKCLRSESNQ